MTGQTLFGGKVHIYKRPNSHFGVGYCISTPGAVRPYERLRDRPKPVKDNADDGEAAFPVYPEPTDSVFPGNHIKMFNNVLAEERSNKPDEAPYALITRERRPVSAH